MPIMRSNLSSFENRRNQIFGLNGVFLSLLWGTWSETRILNLGEYAFLMLFLGCFLIQLPFFIWLALPRKSKVSLKLLDTLDQTIENLISYYNQISIYLGETAGITRWIYRLFAIQVVAFLCLFLIQIIP